MKDDGTVAAPGEPGELFMSHRARDGRLPPHRGAAHRDEGGRWKSVGDIAYADDEGYLYICDRKKDMIISGGVNIYPAEIEAVIHQHPQVLDVAVFGIPDDEWGESVYCIVQPKAGGDARPRRARRVRRGADGRVQAPARPTSCATSSRAPTRASSSSGCCATSSGRTATRRYDCSSKISVGRTRLRLSMADGGRR